MKSRIFILNLLFLILAAVIVMRFFSLQVSSHELYKNLAENQHQLFKILVPVRGEIYMQESKNGKLVPAITNIEKKLVYAVPPEIADKVQTAAALSPLLEMPRQEILQKISDDARKWVAVKKELPESTSQAISELKLPGIYLQPETYRHHPEGPFASQVLGFYAFREHERAGQYGLEERFEDSLAGLPGSLTADRDIRGRFITGGTREIEPAVDGADLILTLDRAIQYKTEAVLKSTVEQHQADSGTIVVLDPKTGGILAMANYPTFDPNVFSKVEDLAVYRNQAVSDAYEPGSVFKVITMAAGLQSGEVTPDMTYEDTGSIALDEFVIRNANNRVHGVQNMTQVLEQSINTGAIFVQQKTGRPYFLETVKNFGFGALTGIELPAETPGNIDNLTKRGGDAHYGTAAFGQGLTVTPLQLAQSLAVIANQGKMMKPYLVKTIRHTDGREEHFQPQEIKQVVSSKTAHTLAAMMVSVVENGHGKRAAVPGYYIAGKTGTAQVARTGGRGYDPDRTIGTFVGFGPVENPAFVIVVKIVNPKTVQFAESTAAPAFGELAQFLVNYFQIPPTR